MKVQMRVQNFASDICQAHSPQVAARLQAAGKDGQWAGDNPSLLLKLMQSDLAADYILDMPAEVLKQAAAAGVGRCRLTVSKPVLKAPMVSALETITSN